jgi:hypothetical protein
MLNNAMSCKSCQADLPNLLFDPAAPQNAAAHAHIAACPSCAQELATIESTMALLDAWEAPEVSPYFNQKLAVRLREEQSSPAPGWFEQLKTRLLLNTGRQFRPAMAGAMALLLIAGGGSFEISNLTHTQQPAVHASATVNDLKILDRNQQALQQMDQLLQDDASTNDTAAPPQS